MSENTETLVLEHLAPMRAAVDPVEQRLDSVTLKHHLRMINRFASIGSRGSKKGLNWPMRKVPS